MTYISGTAKLRELIHQVEPLSLRAELNKALNQTIEEMSSK